MIFKAYPRRLLLVALTLLIGACYLPRQVYQPLPTQIVLPATVTLGILSTNTYEPSITNTPSSSEIPFPSPSPDPSPQIIIEPTLSIPTEPAPTVSPKLGTVDYDVTYCTNGGVDLIMDVYYPPKMDGLWHLIVNIHGGGWLYGNKLLGESLNDIPALLDAGFLFVSIEYRRPPTYPFPAMIEDVKCAVRYFRTFPEQYNIDPDKIGAFGFSAGGHLAALLGLADGNAGWDVGDYIDQSSSVQAVVDYFGISDLTQPDFLTDPDNQIPIIFGVADRSSPVFTIYSPVYYISPDDPPFLIVHGVDDTKVPISQSRRLHAMLTGYGVPSTLVEVFNADHGFVQVGDDPISPTREEIRQLVVEFFNTYLK
jgi:acetyl esterase/lipase